MISHLGFSQSIIGLHGGCDNRNSRERNKNEIVLTKKLSLPGALIDQNALRFSQMQYGLLKHFVAIAWKFVPCRQRLSQKVINMKHWLEKKLHDGETSNIDTKLAHLDIYRLTLSIGQ